MESIILIFVATATACFGFLLGFIVRARTRRQTDPNDIQDKAPAQNPDPKPETEPVVTNKAPNRNWNEVANLWRDRRDGRLIFQIADQHFKRGDELTSRERELLLKVIMDFYRWLEPPSVLSSNSKVSDRPESTIESKPNQVSAPQTAPSQKPPESSQEEQAEPNKGRLNPVNFVSRVLSAEVNVPAPASLSMVAQVDSILQEKVEAANMQKWAIRLIESATKGMIVLVGLEQYEAIDEVPYRRVRSIIRESVAEWERRAEAGEIAQ